KACQTIVYSADLEAITIKQVRRDAEIKLGLTTKFLDKQPWKDLILDFVTEMIQKQKSEEVSVASSSKSKLGRAGKKSTAIQSKKDLEPAAEKIGNFSNLK
ncbi:996_t:CDS:2, partial [Scutellospora calospora]